ncbi:MAG: multiheme c-type cytochrome [Kofleriaceae bacterium]
MKYVLILIALVACNEDKYDVARLEDPNTCKDCHPKHYDQWSGSMHAYASEDPVFVAMNARGQREAQLGTFCVNCHAPMAVKLGLTDGTNYDPSTLPPEAKGITCYFCHNVDKVSDDHNNGLVLAMDQTMRGGATKPADTPAHDSLYDKNLMSADSQERNSTMCGSCHDIVTPQNNVHIERSYQEWQTTIFAQQLPSFGGVTCAKCHMKPSDGVIAEGSGLSVGNRTQGFHDHGFPAIDQAITDFPNKDVQLAGISDILNPALNIVGIASVPGKNPGGGICLEPPGTLTVRTDTFSVGHMFPSGASQDRRVWLEVIAYDASNNVLFHTGEVPDGKDPEDLTAADDDSLDTLLCTGNNTQDNRKCGGWWDRMYKADGSRADFFWEVANETSYLLKPAITTNIGDPAFDHSTTVTYDVSTIFGQIDHISATVRTRPFPYAMLNKLVASGDLDPQYAMNLHTLTAGDGNGATRTWEKATAGTGASINTGCNYMPP